MDESTFGCTMSCDEFMRFWQNKGLRNYIWQQSWLLSKSKEDCEDLRQEAWAAICMLPTDCTTAMAQKVAYTAMKVIYNKEYRRQKKVPILHFS